MSADHPAPSADRLRRRGNRIAALFVLLALLLLGLGAYLLADSQSKDREQLRTRYANGAGVASSLLDALFNTAFSSGVERAATQFSGEVTTKQLDVYTKTNRILYTAILNSSGRLIAASSRAPADAGAAVIKGIGKSGIAISDVQQVGAEKSVESALRFPVGKDSRFIVSASPFKVFSGFLSGSIQPLIKYGGKAYVLDGGGGVLGAVSADNPKQPPPPSAELIRLAKTELDGLYSAGGEQYFAAQPVANTGWHVAVTAPTSELYKPSSGVGRWLPWVILGILGLALIAIGMLVRRALEASAQVAVVNAQLEASQDRLRERAIELQASNAELQRSNAELEQFAYVASHDLSAPLRAVAGFSQLLGVRYKGKLDGDADQFIVHMQEGVDRMQRIIDDLLTYSRVDSSGLQAEPVDLDAVLGEVLHGLGPEIAERGARVTHDQLGQGFGQAGQLSQALQNLVANGMKFTAPGVTPEVHVSATRAGDRIEISARDNGIGVDDEHTEQIFKMFQRLHSGEDYPGTGIGLAIVKKIIDRHGGQIRVEPVPGGGTIFTIDIPAEMPS